MVYWYHGINMQTIATNIRFDKYEYEELKRMSLLEKSSIAQLIRNSFRFYKKRKNSGKNDKKRLIDLMLKSRIKIGTSTVALAHAGRKYE